jgi:hypothetical protein
MKKQSTFDPDTPLPPHGSVPELANRRPCLFCHRPTLIATLSNYGARCFRCYEDYCTELQPVAKHLTPEQKRAVRAKFAQLAQQS